jgi:hypothetical protein
MDHAQLARGPCPVIARSALEFLMCAGLAARALAGGPVELDPALVARVQSVLTPPATAAAPSQAAMTSALVALGDGALPVVVALLAGEVEVPETARESLDPVHPAAVAARSDVLRAALARLDQSALVEHLALRAGGDAALDWKLFALGLLARVDEPQAPRAALDIAASIEPIHLLRSYVLESVELALSAQIERRPETLDLIEVASREAGPELCCALARSAARVRCALSVEFLAQLLGQHAEADPVILGALGELADGGLAIDSVSLGHLRELLSSEDLDTQRATAVALGRLRDEGSLEALCALLVDHDARVSSAARWSLRILVGTDLGATPEPWLAWMERERAWWTDRAPKWLEDLRSDQVGEVLNAIRELMQHPVLRHDVSEALGPLLVHPDRGVALAANDAILRLGSSRALTWLAAALASDDERVRESAHGTLRQLTGLQLPPDGEQWAKALQR